MRRFFSGDAAFARPGLYECFEAEGYLHAIRPPANAILEAEVAVPPDLFAATPARIERLRARPTLAKSGWPTRKLNRRVHTFGTTVTISTAQGSAARN